MTDDKWIKLITEHFVNKKTGKKYMTFWDRDRKRYTTANSEIVSITYNIFQKGVK